MMWDHVMERLKTEILGDTILTAIIGPNYRVASTGELLIPSIESSLVADSEVELWSPVIIQFDIWTEKATQERIIERRLRQLYHRDLPRELGGVRMFMVFQDGTSLSTPDRSGFTGRSLRFQFTPLREQYARSSLE